MQVGDLQRPLASASISAMFDGLQGKLTDVFRNLRGEGKVTEETLQAALRQIRLALLEADVHIRVVRPFITRVREKALGQDVLRSLSAPQQVFKIVYDELQGLLGEEGQELLQILLFSAILLEGLISRLMRMIKSLLALMLD